MYRPGLVLSLVLPLLAACSSDSTSSTSDVTDQRGAADIADASADSRLDGTPGVDQKEVSPDLAADVTSADLRPDEASPDTLADLGPDLLPEDVVEDVAGDSAPPSDVSDVQEEIADTVVGPDIDSDGYIVPPAALCDAPADACGAPAEAAGIWASYRKDYYLSDEKYKEYTDYPLQGGRFHIAAIAQVSGTVTGVTLNGADINTLLVEPKLEWYHVWPTSVVAGQPVWVSFHSRDSAWDSAATGTIQVLTDAGAAVDGTFPVSETLAPLTYVTTADGYSQFLIHIKNNSAATVHLSRLLLNGKEVLASGVACAAETAIAPQASTLITVPLCTPVAPGEAWTVVAEYSDSPAAVGVGRVILERFPVEAWANSDECALPVPGQENFQRLRDAFIDTPYVYWGLGGKCNVDFPTMINVTAPSIPEAFIMMSDDFTDNMSSVNSITNTQSISAFMTGDESDGEIYNEDTGVPNAWNKAQASNFLWAHFPEVPTYNGAKTNGHVGTFAGMADIQGIDLYVAACAPHITQFLNHPPVEGAYDYLLNTRNNHMPLPTWQYAQGLSPVWNKDGLFGGEIHVQPDPQEILVQAFSVMAAGGKGLMWFQVNQEEAEYKPQRWEAIARASRWFRGVRKFLREGDLTGAATSDAFTIVDAIRARDAIIVPIINIKTSSGPDDIKCGGALATEALVPHWQFSNTYASVQVTIPKDFGLVEVFEVFPGETKDIQVVYQTQVAGRKVTISNIPLSNSNPVRLLVFAASAEVRPFIEQEMMPLPPF